MKHAGSPVFDLSLFGRFELHGANGPIALTNKKLCALLGYLACGASKGHSRDKLMTLLWGSHFEVQAKQNLRQALTRLRRILGQNVLLSDGETVRLQAGAIECDVARFKTLVVRRGNREALAKATELYTDRFFADIAISEEAWTDWLRTERQRLEDFAVDAMVGLAEQHLQSRDFKNALAAAKRAIAINGLREDAHCLAIRAVAETGNKGLALKHYEELLTFLRRELDVGPGATTLALAAELRRSQTQTNLEEPPATRPSRLSLKNRPNVDWHPPCKLTRWHG